MGRLIDANVLLQDIRENMPNYEVKEDFLLFVHAQPTAYDVETVLKQLKEAEKDVSNLGTYAIPKDEAIKIALKGGINE